MQPPPWLEIRPVPAKDDAALDRLHPGEREAILLAEALRPDLIIRDEKAARLVAGQRGLNVTGLLGVLDQAAAHGLIDLPAAVERLRHTTFRALPQLLKLLLDRHQKKD